jgi:hypothetical protein
MKNCFPFIVAFLTEIINILDYELGISFRRNHEDLPHIFTHQHGDMSQRTENFKVK